jgi:hypothetical protein
VDKPRLLTAEDLLEKADSLVMRYLEIRVADGVPYHRDFVIAFQAATRLIAPVLNRPTFLYVIVGSSPFELRIGHHKLVFEQSETVSGTHLNGVIFLNFGRLSPCSLKMMTAGILEELAHGMLSIKDEHLVRNVVSYLWPAVRPTEIAYAERVDDEPFTWLQPPQTPVQT